MKKLFFPFLGMLFLIVSCNEIETGSYDEGEVNMEIQKLGEDIVWALNEANTDTLMRDFWHSESTTFMIDGNKVEGYENIKSVIEQIPNRRKNLDLEVDDERILVLSEDIAIQIVEFHEEITHMNDSISTGQGIWSTVYQQMGDQWKIIMVHESHLRN